MTRLVGGPRVPAGRAVPVDANLAARQSIYAYQHPPVDLPAQVLDLVDRPAAGVVADIGCGNGRYLANSPGAACAGT